MDDSFALLIWFPVALFVGLMLYVIGWNIWQVIQ